MRDVSKRLLCAAIGMAVAGQTQGAAIKLDAFVDGQPAAMEDVLLNGQSIGGSRVGESFWYEEVAGGRHRLEVRIAGESVSYEFSVSDDEAAVITLNHGSATGESTKSLQRIELSNFRTDQGGERVVITPSAAEGLAPGLIRGTVVNREGDSPIRNVTVKVLDGDRQALTDRYGNFELELPPGLYELQLEHDQYNSSRLTDLRVLPKMNLAVDVQLSPAGDIADDSSAIDEVVVVARYTPSNPIAIERISSSVVDSIDFTQIARFDDSMVSSAIRRVVGVTLEDDRYPVVRGMKSRYQSTDFNGATLPSTDPGRRDLPLDIFPAGIMQGLSLQKSATADVPSSATAGHIGMRTKSVPDQPFFKLSYSATFGDMHGDDMLMSSTEGDRDWLGMDDGSREIPDELELSLGKWVNLDQGSSGYGGFNGEEIIKMTQSFEHNAIHEGEARGDYSLDLSGGNGWEIAGQNLGVIGALRYSDKWSNNTKSNDRFTRTTVPGDGVTEERILLNQRGETRDTNNVIDLSAMLNLQWDIDERHRLGLNNIALRHTTNSAEIETIHTDSNLTTDNNDLQRTKRQRVDWIEEQLLSHQLWGAHSFDLSFGGGWTAHLGDLSVDWQLMSADTEYDRPNATQYTYYAESPYSSYRYRSSEAGDQYNLWEGMEESSQGYRLDVELPIEDLSGVSLLLKAGATDLQREREGFYHRYSVRGGPGPAEMRENPDPTQILLPEMASSGPGAGGIGGSELGKTHIYVGDRDPKYDVGLAGNNYVVEQNADAAYGLVEANIFDKVKANLGVRKESFHLVGEQYMYTIDPYTELLDEERNSTSLSLTYLFNDAWQLRAAYSETVSWPEIFEMLPRVFYDVETLERYIGNPDLKPADITNYDLRLEWYPSETESITFALFSKDITNAIENRFSHSGDVYDTYTFTNARSAEVQGAELDLRREFVLGADRGHELFVQFNYTHITSSVELTDGIGVGEYDTERPLQGQPDYIVNLQLGYDHIDSGQEVTLVFNRKGEELAVVNPGNFSTVANVYEMPFDDLRLIYKKNFLNGLSVSASVDNLLDAEHNLEYEGYGLPYLNYASGRKFKLKMGYSF